MSETENKEVENADTSEQKLEVPSSPQPTRVQEMKDNISVCSSEVTLRQHPRGERPASTLSSRVSPSFYLAPKRQNSTSDFQNGRQVKDGIKKSDNMVLQLVLPRNNTNPNFNFENGNLYSFSGQNSPVLNNHNLKGRHPPPSLNVIKPDESSDISGSQLALSPGVFSTNSVKSFPHIDTPTPPEKKKKAFSDILINTCSLFYALFNVTIGLALNVADIIDGSHATPEIFSLLLVSIACIFILYLIIDISLFTHKQQKYQKQIDQQINDNNIHVTELPDGDFQYNIVLPDVLEMRKKLRHDYCFNYDRHSTNFYLKIGAAAFCLGHLIHLGLLIGYQLIILTSEDADLYECVSVITVTLNFVYPFYSFLLLFFIFKYSNVIINKSTVLVRFGVMHCLSASICFWMWTIVREVLEALVKEDSYDTTTNSTEEEVEFEFQRFTKVCDHDGFSRTIFKVFSPYLYPFSVEFSILIVGVLYLVWSNIEKCDAENEDEDEHSTLKCKKPIENSDNEKGNIVIYANCHASNKGLFGGFVILLITIISFILFFCFIYGSSGDESSENGLLVNRITAIVILSVMLAASLPAYRQIAKLDLNSVHHNLLDDILLFICIPAFFLNGIFSFIPAIIKTNILMLVLIPLEIVQVLVQTVFMLDGVRRSSNTKKLRLVKPGRELVTFLIIANVSLWLFQTFEVKAHGLEDERYEYFGKELWTILGHMCLPLMMFYRFHSSVCLCDIWKYAYEPSGH